MSNVEFPEEEALGNSTSGVPKSPTMVKWVMKTGLVRDEAQANYVLIGIAVIFFMLTFIFIVDWNTTTQQSVLYIEDLPKEELSNIPPEILETLPSRSE